MVNDVDRLLSWSANVFGTRATVASLKPLRTDGSPWMLEITHGNDLERVVLKAGGAEMRAELATEAAALQLAGAHELPAPRLLAADLDGDDAGCMALLMTYLKGSDQIPLALDRDRLRATGAAAAELHAIPLTPTGNLPLRDRPMPWIDFVDERRLGRSPSTPLLRRGDRLMGDTPRPVVDPVFVHGDLWAGNLLWRNDSYLATIDWEAAGAGSYGVDLGSLRLDAALLYGLDAPDEVLVGWQSASGRQALDVAYWDLAAVLNTSADMTGATPTMHAAGRSDLDGAVLTRRRDAFLEATLSQLA